MPDNLDAVTEPLATMLREPIDPRTLPVRFSRLKHIARSPAHYFQACQWPDGEQSLSMRLGSGVHAIVLGTPVVRFPGRRAGGAWDAFKAEHAGKTILNAAEWDEAHRMAQAITSHRAAMDLLFADAAQIEREIKWRCMGRECSSRPDSWSPFRVVDLKTCRTAEPAAFTREALRMHYHVQLAAYQDAIGYATGGAEPERAYIVAVENDAPHAVTLFEVSPRALEQGARTWCAWFDRLLVCEATNQWPAYSEAPVLLDTPEDPFTTWSDAA